MHAAPAGRASGPGAPSAAGLAVFAAAAGLVAWSLLFGGGSGEWRLAGIGAVALAAVGAAAAAVLLGRLPRPSPGPAGLAFVGLLTAFVAWNGVSIAWSLQPDRSWSYTNRGLVYLAFACLGLFVGSLVPRASSRLPAALAVVLAVVLGWALLGKVIPGLFPDGGRVARLRNPIGYWNALALTGDVAVLLGLWLATRPERVSGSEPQTLSGGRVRLAGALLVYGAIVTVALTYSRAAVVVGVLVVGAWFLLARPGLDGLGALILAGTAATVVAGVALALPGVSEDGQPHDARVRAGLVFGLALLAGAAFVWVAGSRLLRHAALPPDRAHALARRALVATGIAAALVLVALVVRAGGPGAWLDDRVDDFTDVQVQPSQGPERIGSFSSGNRWTWWKEAWHGFADNPVEGTGAGSFGLSHRIQRRTFSPPTTEPHNVALQFLSETGLIGFLLAGGAAGAAGLAVRSTLRSLPVGERAAALPLALGTAAYGLHSLVDFHWDFVAVTGPVLLVLGALATAGRPPAPVRASQPVWAAGAGALALAAVFSVTSPWLAERKLDQALEALGRGDVTTGIERAKTAHELNPLRLDPLLVWASAATARRDLPEAKRLYRKAVRLQPKNADAWYEFGVFELEDDRFPLQAYRYLNRSYTLDRFGPAGRKGGALDRARAAVNRAATRPKPRPRGRPSAPPP